MNAVNDRKHQYVVIMAGGVGSRFWPESREKLPKQFLDILNCGRTLLQSTYNRFAEFIDPAHIFVVTGTGYVQLVLDQLPQMPEKQIIVEPIRRNTAPCIAYAAFKLHEMDHHASMIVAPSDHHITETNLFVDALQHALEFAAHSNTLVTLGITPTRPHTGYGYIQFDEELSRNGMYKVKTFTEKPSFEIAQTFLKFGDFLWNSGIFIWSAKSIIDAFRTLQPDIYEVFHEGKDAYNTPREHEFIIQAYMQTRNISIDYAIMEHARNVYVIPANFGWSDLGNWSSLWEKHDKDSAGNAVSGSNVMVYESDNCMIRASGDKLVIVQGLSDYCIIDTREVLLICRMEDEQKIREMNHDVLQRYGNRYA